MRYIATSSQKLNNLFFYAVDMRAANDSSYIHTALLNALSSAADKGFGNSSNLKITNYSNPLQSNSISEFLIECTKKNELIILVFDQFEELYSKSELFSVFKEARRLMYSTVSTTSNFVLGFAWKTDSTVPQDHPAYHMWHQLSDHRYEIQLKPFDHTDAKESIIIFEKELGQQLLPELRTYLLENSQGYPWLLKKLCIHIYQQLLNNTTQHELANRSLDISSLFDQDLNNLTDVETGCMKLVAKEAPMDWYEVLDSFGHQVVQSLQDKRLLIRRGNKLNLYWDIFRDYVLSKKIPSIPFNYIPQSSSLKSLLSVVAVLDASRGKKVQELSSGAKLKESTINNILHDLVQFGIVTTNKGKVMVNAQMENFNKRTVLSNIRLIYKRHALTEKLKENNISIPASPDNIISYLKEVNPIAHFQMRTWRTYGVRMIIWLNALGLVRRTQDEIYYQDSGDISDESTQISNPFRGKVFCGDTSPRKVINALDLLKAGPKSQLHMKQNGYRNACVVLRRFNLIELTTTGDYRVRNQYIRVSSKKLVWEKSSKEKSIEEVTSYLKSNPSCSAEDVGNRVSKLFLRDWTRSSCIRNGGALRQWATWHLSMATQDGGIPKAPGFEKLGNNNLSLFEN